MPDIFLYWSRPENVCIHVTYVGQDNGTNIYIQHAFCYGKQNPMYAMPFTGVDIS